LIAVVVAAKGKVLGQRWFKDDPENTPPQPNDGKKPGDESSGSTQ